MWKHRVNKDRKVSFAVPVLDVRGQATPSHKSYPILSDMSRVNLFLIRLDARQGKPSKLIWTTFPSPLAPNQSSVVVGGSGF